MSNQGIGDMKNYFAASSQNDDDDEVNIGYN